MTSPQTWARKDYARIITADPLIGVSVFFAEFSKRSNCRRVIEYLHRHEEIKIMNVYLCFLVCLHFPIGRYHRCGVPESPQSPFRLSSSFFSQHVH